MITYAKLINWREYGEAIILECLVGEEYIEISTYKNHIYNAHLLKDQVYIRLDSAGRILGIDILQS
ncbi:MULTISPECIES: hypothetical protein [unclassified Bacillus cereus group]|uniref:hypothetical protein n=1 Tax=unclassified Bacillus cereus group TaxID=2750818 RepID=UPI001F58895C|nr:MULTISPECIES: hypothetical protein [unclassified Bacillus cereus group]